MFRNFKGLGDGKYMKKPRYMEELLKIIFLWLGIMFATFGILGFFGIMKPKASSMVQAPVLLGIIFGLLGIGFIVVSIVLQLIVAKKDKLHKELLISGRKIEGIVEKVYLQTYTQYGHQSPYIILYSFTYEDQIQNQKSYYLWEKPDLVAGDSIKVYVNEFGKSTVSI